MSHSAFRLFPLLSFASGFGLGAAILFGVPVFDRPVFDRPGSDRDAPALSAARAGVRTDVTAPAVAAGGGKALAATTMPDATAS